MKRILKWFALISIVLIVTLGAAFWLRPLSVFRVFNQAQMYFIGARGSFIDVGEYRIHYYTLGPADGPIVVLVHGLGGRSEDWGKLAPYLAKAGYHVYLPDLPGFGESDKPADFSYSVKDEAAVITGFFDALGFKQVDLGGWSMGGWIVQLVAAEHPERIRRLMLFDSAGLYLKPSWDIKLFTPVSPAELERFDALLMPRPPLVPEFIAKDILRSSHQHAWIIHRALDSMMTGRDTTDNLLPTLKMPVLIVWGDVDRITPLTEGQRIHELISQSKMRVISGCGHLAPNECADQIGPEAVNFLKQ